MNPETDLPLDGEILPPSFMRPRSKLADEYAEWRFREAIQDMIRECGGNRLYAQGIAIDIVKEETRGKEA